MLEIYEPDCKVVILFNEELSQDRVNKIVKDSFKNDDLIEVINLDGHKVELLWCLGEDGSSGDIEIALYYTLEHGTLGTYEHEYIV